MFRSSSQFPFQIVRLLGEGAAAKVWLGYHEDTEQVVALKVFEVGTESSRQMEDFFRETRMVARASHPNILQVYGSGRSDVAVVHDGALVIEPGQLYLVSEFIAGGSLEQHVGLMRWNEIQRVVLEILKGLGRVHGRGIVHLDLKPANVLFSDRGPVISDFGLATSYISKSVDGLIGNLSGTPHYMAPEQGLSQTHLIGPWTDLYAVGCLTVELFTGQPVYESSNVIDAILAHRDQPIPKYEHRFPVPIGFDDWLKRMLSKAWNGRFQRASEAARALRGLKMGTPRTPDIGLRDTVPAQYSPQGHRPLPRSQETKPEPPSAAPTPTGPPSVDKSTIELTRPTTRDWYGRSLSGFGGDLVSFEDCQLVDRGDEQDRLWSALSQAIRTQRSAHISIEGTTGMGKTVLCGWLATAAHEHADAEVIWVNHHPTCGQHDGVMGALRTYFCLVDGDTRNNCRQITERLALPPDQPLCRDLATLFASNWTADPVESSRAVIPIDESIMVLVRFINLLADSRPLVIIVDDAQWAYDTLNLLNTYVTRGNGQAICVVSTVRTDASDGDPRALANLAKLSNSISTDQLSLGPITKDAVKHWFRSTIGEREEVCEKLAIAAKGNPLSMKVLMFGVLTQQDRRELDTPPSVASLLRKRLIAWKSSVPKDARLALQVLAVLGHRVTRREWSGVMRRVRSSTRVQLLDPAIRAQFVALGSNDVITFRHGLFVEIIKEQARKSGALARLHRVVAEFLSAEDGPQFDRIAQHYEGAELYDAAAEKWCAAAMAYSKRNDYRNCRWALLKSSRCLRASRTPLRDRRWKIISIEWVKCLRFMKETAKVSRRIHRLCRGVEHDHDHELSAKIWRERAHVDSALNGRETAIVPMGRALIAAEHGSDPALEMTTRLELILFLLIAKKRVEATRHLVIITEQVTSDAYEYDTQLLSRFNTIMSVDALHRYDWASAIRFAQEAVDLARKLPSKATHAAASCVLGNALWKAGDLKSALHEYQKAFRLWNSFHSVDTPIASLNQTVLHLLLGDFGRALKCAEQSYHLCGSGTPILRSLAEGYRTAVYAYMGRWDKFDESSPVLKRLASVDWADNELAELMERTAHRCIDRGELARGRRAFRVLRHHAKELTNPGLFARIPDLDRLCKVD